MFRVQAEKSHGGNKRQWLKRVLTVSLYPSRRGWLAPIFVLTPGQEAAQMPQVHCDPMDCSLPGSSVHGISQARILQQVAISYSRGSFQLRDQNCTGRWILYYWDTREALKKNTFVEMCIRFYMLRGKYRIQDYVMVWWPRYKLCTHKGKPGRRSVKNKKYFVKVVGLWVICLTICKFCECVACAFEKRFFFKYVEGLKCHWNIPLLGTNSLRLS